MTRKELKEKLPDDWDYQEHNGRVHIKDGNKNVCQRRGILTIQHRVILTNNHRMILANASYEKIISF